MNEISKNLELYDNFTILGGEKDQVLQFILKNNKGIVTKRHHVHYRSSSLEETLFTKKIDLVHHKEKTTELDTKHYKKIKDDKLIRFKNTKMTFEYIGIANGGIFWLKKGKIMKIHPILYNNLFIRYDKLLAFSDNIELYENPKISKSISTFCRKDALLLRDNRFYMIYAEKLKVVSNENISLAEYQYTKDYVFLNSDCVGEEIIIRNNSLIAFEDSVMFVPVPDEQPLTQKTMFSVVGPGLIIYEISHINTRKEEMQYNARILTLIFFAFFICLLLVTKILDRYFILGNE